MPTVLRLGPYRFFFYSNEHGKPSHIHVGRERKLAKFWLDPIAVARSKRFAARELSAIRKHIEATPGQLQNYELLGDDEGIHWSDLDEDTSVEGLLR